MVVGCGGSSLSTGECKSGEEFRGGECVPVGTCGPGTVLVNSVCSPHPIGGAGGGVGSGGATHVSGGGGAIGATGGKHGGEVAGAFATGGVGVAGAGGVGVAGAGGVGVAGAGGVGVAGCSGHAGNEVSGMAGVAGDGDAGAAAAGFAGSAAGFGGSGAGAAGLAGSGAGTAGSAGAIDGGRASGNYLIDAAHDNLQPNDAVASPLSPRWAETLSGVVTYPVIAQGRLFVGTNDGTVTALDAQTGTTLWDPHLFPSGDSSARVMVATELDRVYALTRDGLLSGLDATSGHEIWSKRLEGQYFFWSAPVAAGGYVYVNGLESGGTTYAVNGATGEVAWTAGTFDGSFGTVAVGGDRVYEAEACDQLSAFDSATGKLAWYTVSGCTGGGGTTPAFYNGWIWERDWASGNLIIGADKVKHGTFSSSLPPAFDGELVFYVNAGGLSAIDIASGKPVWAFSDDLGLCGAAAVAGARGQVFVGSSSGTVYELDAATGHEISSAHVDSYNCAPEVNALAIAGGHLFVPSGNRLIAF